MSPSQMGMTLIPLHSRSLLHRQYATQMRQGGYRIWVQPITYILGGNGFLVLRD